MARPTKFISLYDKPTRQRRPIAQEADAPDLGTIMLTCMAITLATVVFFWAYDLIVHRGPIFVPTVSQAGAGQLVQTAILDVPVPDMQSPDVVRANSDAPSWMLEKENPIADESKQGEGRSRKRRRRTARRLSPEASRAYDAASSFLSPPPFGGW
jgi:hypothetical protein